MIDIADKYTDATQKATYKEAVKKFRLPYWDYYRPRDYDARFPGVTRSDGTTYYPYDFRAPQILTVRTVKVRMYPDGRPEEIPNPLSRYKFPDESTGFFSGLDWATTRFDVSLLVS
jgi:tyrosinase